MPSASAASSTRPEGAQMPTVAGSRSARGSRTPRSRGAEGAARPCTLAATGTQLLEGDEVPVGILEDEPARPPVRRLGLRHDVRAGREGLEARIDVVDVEVDGGPRGAAGLLRERNLDPAAGEHDAAARAVAAPLARHLPAEDVAIERDRPVEVRRRDEEVVEAVGHGVLAQEVRCWWWFCAFCASTTASAVMLMMRRTVADGVRMCTGFAAPSRIGPTVMPYPPTVFRRLNAMFAASRVGITSRFASPFRRELGNAARRTSSESAASACISPSISSAGMRSWMRARASRIFTAEGALLDPKLEWETSATFAVRPKRRISSTAREVISRSCSGVGSWFAYVSQIKTVR